MSGLERCNRKTPLIDAISRARSRAVASQTLCGCPFIVMSQQRTKYVRIILIEQHRRKESPRSRMLVAAHFARLIHLCLGTIRALLPDTVLASTGYITATEKLLHDSRTHEATGHRSGALKFSGHRARDCRARWPHRSLVHDDLENNNSDLSSSDCLSRRLKQRLRWLRAG
jgi:hypothetical protein